MSAAHAAPAAHPEPEDVKLLPHDHDGIQECDNPAPPWLTRTFVACIIFAAAYFTYYHVLHRGQTMQQQFAENWAAYQKEEAAVAATEQIDVTEQSLTEMAHERSAVAQGRAIFTKNCISCHTANGRGLVGPNLTDDFQIHGSTRMDLYNTIYNGVLDKGMPVWSQQLAPNEIALVAAYVSTLRGTNVPGGKAPQGAKVGPFPK